MATITLDGRPLTLAGIRQEAGRPAPDARVTANDLSEVALRDIPGIKVITSVWSLETPVCDAHIRKFHEKASSLDGVQILVISMDLPFTQQRWCGAAGLAGVTTLSDHRNSSFGVNYGVLIEEQRLLARSVFVVDADNVITYVEYVPEISQQPDFDKALAAVRAAQSAGGGIL